MTEDVGKPLYVWGRHDVAKSLRAHDPNKPACDLHGLESIYVLPPLTLQRSRPPIGGK